MKTVKFIVLSVCIALITLQGCNDDDDNGVDPLTSSNFVVLNSAMHKLWADHMQWTFATVDAYFHNPSGVTAQLNRLLQNQKDLGAAIIPYYGQQAGDSLTVLLTTHIQQAIPVLDAAKANDQAALDAALANWYKNANDIADFLSAANPNNWPKTEMEQMMKIHIDQTTVYAVDLLNNDYGNAVIHYDEAFNHMMEMADMLSRGIAQQFPDKF